MERGPIWDFVVLSTVGIYALIFPVIIASSYGLEYAWAVFGAAIGAFLAALIAVGLKLYERLERRRKLIAILLVSVEDIRLFQAVFGSIYISCKKELAEFECGDNVITSVDRYADNLTSQNSSRLADSIPILAELDPKLGVGLLNFINAFSMLQRGAQDVLAVHHRNIELGTGSMAGCEGLVSIMEASSFELYRVSRIFNYYSSHGFKTLHESWPIALESYMSEWDGYAPAA